MKKECLTLQHELIGWMQTMTTVTNKLRSIAIDENEKRQRANMRFRKYKFDEELVQKQLDLLSDKRLFYEQEIRDVRDKIAKQIVIRNNYLRDIDNEKEKQSKQKSILKSELYDIRENCDKEMEKIRELRRDIREERIERENLQHSLMEHKHASKDKDHKRSATGNNNNRLKPIARNQVIISPRTKQRMINFKLTPS